LHLNKNVLFVAPSEENHHKDIFEDKHSKKINNPKNLGHPQNEKIENNFSYYKIPKLRIWHKIHDFTINIQNISCKTT